MLQTVDKAQVRPITIDEITLLIDGARNFWI